jgi:hypothetical protein
MFPPSRIIYLTEETVETLYYTITFRARCSGLILALYKTSIIDSSPPR